MGLEPASPNFKTGEVLGQNLVVDIDVVALDQPSALRTVLLASSMRGLTSIVLCDRVLRDWTWHYLRAKYLTDFVRDIAFPSDSIGGYRIGSPPATIEVDRITYDNMHQLARLVMSLS